MQPRVSHRLDDLVVQFLEKIEGGWIDQRQIVEIGRNIGIRELAAEILFLTELKKIAAHIPAKAYHDPGKAEQLLDAIQQALDAAIEREEEQEAAS